MAPDAKINTRRARAFKVIESSRLETKTVSEWQRRGIIVLVGSYVSTILPTGLPSGTAVCDGLWQMIFGQGWPEWLRRDFLNVPFEALMQCYPRREVVRAIIRKMFSVDVPNPVHCHIAASLRGGLIKGIITTNYDLAFESCVQDIPGAKTIDDIVGYREYGRERSGGRICFKIHGTAAKEKEDTIICDLQSEGVLPGWKRKLLCDMLENRVAVLIGYSGRDFDICPELAETTRQAQLIWLQPKRAGMSANARRVLRQAGGIVVEGDLIGFLERILDVRVDGLPKNDSVWKAENYFDPGTSDRWRMNILNWMGCGRLGLEELANLDCDYHERLKIQADMCGHIGRYRDAVAAVEEMRQKSAEGASDRTRLEIDIASRNFLYGRQWKAWRAIRRLERGANVKGCSDSETATRLVEAKIVMYTRAVEIARVIHWRQLVRRIQVAAQRDYDHVFPLLEKESAYSRLQTLQLNAERIGIKYSNRLLLPSREGYRSLGLVSMDVIAKRDEIRSAPSGRLSISKVLVARSCLAKAERYGWEHEAWKFNWILLWRSRKHKVRYFRGWLKHFCKTQYPPLFRVLQLTMKSIASRDKGALGPPLQMGRSKKGVKSDEGESQAPRETT